MSSTPRLFVPSDRINGNKAVIEGSDAHYLKNVHRLDKGGNFIICDMQRTEYNAVITAVTGNAVEAELSDQRKSETESGKEIHLYQALAKGDKFEFIIQKAVELGVSSVTPVLAERCISRPDNKTMPKKVQRYNGIALSAAMQSGRGIVPAVNDSVSFEKAVFDMKKADFYFACYEGESEKKLKDYIVQLEKSSSVSFYIGPEGGVSNSEYDLLVSEKIPLVSLGGRILRTETAPLYVLSVLDILCN